MKATFATIVLAAIFLAWPSLRNTSAAPAPDAGNAPATQPSPDATALVNQLGDDDPHVRREAAKKLRAMGKAAIPALKEAGKNRDPEVQAQAQTLLEDLDAPPSAGPFPQPIGGGSLSVTSSLIDQEKVVDINEPGRATHIEQNPLGIKMTVTGQVNGHQVTRNYKAKNPDDLRHQEPEAFALYQRYAVNAEAGNMRFQALVQQQPLLQGPAQGNLVVRPLPNAGDDLDGLTDKIDAQLREKNIDEAQRGEITRLLNRLKILHGLADNQPAADQVKEYNQTSDLLRKKLSELKLADPGVALPPPASSRLGVSVSEDGVSDGPIVQRILPDSRAAKLGLQEGDIITKIDGKAVDSTRALRNAVLDAAGKPLTIDIVRDGQAKQLKEK